MCRSCAGETNDPDGGGAEGANALPGMPVPGAAGLLPPASMEEIYKNKDILPLDLVFG